MALVCVAGDIELLPASLAPLLRSCRRRSRVDDSNSRLRAWPTLVSRFLPTFGVCRPQSPGAMQIQLVRKLADYLDGIDVSKCREGENIDLPRSDAELLIAE